MRFLQHLIHLFSKPNHSNTSGDAVWPQTLPSYKPEAEQTNDPFVIERNRLAELCKMGDVAAMYAMAELMLTSCPEPAQAAIQQYESDPCEEAIMSLDEYVKAEDNDAKKLKYYMMWIVRAAVYGHEKAKELLDKCAYYKEHAYIPYKHYVKEDSQLPIWPINDLYDAGLCDMIRDEEGCQLYFDQSVEYIRLIYASYSCSADDDGFGAETVYESVFFDEFFKRIPILRDPIKNETVFGLEQVKAEREAFWKARRQQD